MDSPSDIQSPQPSIFAFNAVNLSNAEVARTFVDPVAFGQLVQAHNAILVGPRGSGKTTLLKMLQSEALERWAAPTADQVAGQVVTSGVFIGADRLWSEQIAAAPESVRAPLGNAAFALHVARSMANVMHYRAHGDVTGINRAHLRVSLSREAESDAAGQLAEYFGLSSRPRTFAGVSLLVQRRLVELGRLRVRAEYDDVDIPEWAFTDVLSGAAAAVNAFNEVADQPDHRWSLLFDELELAPPALVRDLLLRLRGNTTLLNFKLSLAPVLEHARLLGGTAGAVEGQDMDVISLAGSRRHDAVRFTVRLFEQYFADRPESRLYRLFGESAIENKEAQGELGDAAETLSSIYSQKGEVGRAMIELSAKDESFKAYLRKNKINVLKLDEVRGSARAATVRKIRNLVVVRNFYRGEDRRRSRKNALLFTGHESLTVFPDGNPRMAMSLLRELQMRLNHSLVAAVPRSEQATAVLAVQDRFIAVLAAQESAIVRNRPMTVLDLLDRIGGKLAHRILEDDFTPDAPAGFKVNAGLPGGVVLLLERAFNAGALVPVDGLDKQRVLDGVVGRAFRLSYLMAPRYRLPMRLGKVVSLASLLNEPALDSSIDQLF